jgi:hypothetical protein
MSQLVGYWHLQSADSALEMTEPVEIEFTPAGELIYSINAGDDWRITRLKFRLDGSALVTHQPSKPQEERTDFAFDKSGRLILDYGGLKATFIRGMKRAPAPAAHDGFVIAKLVAWYVFNIAFTIVGSLLAVHGDGSTKGMWLVFVVLGSCTLVCGFLSVAYMMEREPEPALKCARSAMVVGFLLVAAMGILQSLLR